MGSLLSRPKAPAHACRFQSEELGNQVHGAIDQQDMELLRCLVNCNKASLQERNDQGMTPLYKAVHCNWPDGALFLLEHGADVKNSEVAPHCLCSSQKPLVQLALRTRSQPLLKKLIERGVSIRVMDIRGEYCVHDPNVPLGSFFSCLADALTEHGSRRPDLLKDLFFVIMTGEKYGVDHLQIEDFIKRQHKSYQGKMFQVFAACHCNGSNPDWDRALHYWRMSAQCTPHQLPDHTEEEESSPRSVFADILDVQDHPLPNTATTREEKLAVCIHALLVIERDMSEDELLTWTGLEVFFKLFGEGKIVTAVGVLRHLTTVRTLNGTEVANLMLNLGQALKTLEDVPETSFVALSESMRTIQNCIISALARYEKACMICPKHFDAFEIFTRIFQVFLHATAIFYSPKVPSTPDQLHDFASRIKEFVRSFPWSLCPSSFYHLARNNELFPSTASLIKILVACIAEAFGEVHQGTCPPHLLSIWNGNAPLHSMALYRSQEDLVQEGVLQCFLDHGADLCTKNDQGETVRSILVRRGVCTEGELLPSLQCLAAAAFMKDERLRQNVGNCSPSAVRNFLLDH